jgi:cytochrome c oxidase cbb3-type subunit I/II
MYIMRLIGGTVYLVGFFVMAWNIFRTIRGGSPQTSTVTVYEEESTAPQRSVKDILLSWPMAIVAATILLMLAFFMAERLELATVIVVALVGVLGAGYLVAALAPETQGHAGFHRFLEGRPLLFSVLTLIAVLIGGVAELLPTLIVDRAVPKTGPVATPYRPLELAGRDIYVREGCYVCHSQMIRPFFSEKLRYGAASTAGEFIYDHPFQWGSKRTGPDLHRVGGKYSNLWHLQHLIDPAAISRGSNMPSYRFLLERSIDLGDISLKLSAMKRLGVPYTANDLSHGSEEAQRQGRAIAADLQQGGVTVPPESELVALIAYLQRLGKHPAQPGQ